jgi:hypothetical protein
MNPATTAHGQSDQRNAKPKETKATKMASSVTKLMTTNLSLLGITLSVELANDSDRATASARRC